MKNNNIPQYILCSTPELARQVLEKIERESDLRMYNDQKPSEYIPNKRHFPLKLFIRQNMLHYYIADSRLNDGDVKAEDFLKEDGLKEQCPNCLDRNDSIPDGLNGSCGVCGGKGFITWKETNIKINNYMTNKTWDNLKVTDVLIDENGKERNIGGIIDHLVGLPHLSFRDEAYSWFSKDSLIRIGYKIKGASEDKPKEIKEAILLLESIPVDYYGSSDRTDICRAIEMLKKLK